MSTKNIQSNMPDDLLTRCVYLRVVHGKRLNKCTEEVPWIGSSGDPLRMYSMF